MVEYVLDPCVEEELWSIWRFIARDDPGAATRVVEAAYETFRSLAGAPGLGSQRQFRDSRLHSVRCWPVRGFSNYLVFYRSVADGVQILHVYHGARDIDALFGGG